MSDFLATQRDADEARDRIWNAPEEEPKPSLMSWPEGVMRGVGQGALAARGGIYARINDVLQFDNRMLEMGVSQGALPESELPKGEAYFERLTRTLSDDAFQSRAILQPDPRRLDFANQIVMGVTEAFTVAGLGELAGGPIGSAALLGNTYAESDYRALREQGVDEDTATGAALRTGGFMAVMGAMKPAYGGGLMSTPARARALNIASGAAINVGLGIGMRSSVGGYLEERGYSEVAKNYAWADSTAIMTDLFLGGFFGGVFGPKARGQIVRPGPDGEPVEIAPTEWTPTDWLSLAERRVEEGDLAEAYALAKVAEERGADGADVLLADIAARRDTAPDASPAEEDDFVPLTDEEYDARAADAFNPAEEDAAFERAYQELKADIELAETGWENATPQQRAAVLALAGAKHRDLDTAPGIPTNPAAQRAHSDALSRADEQMAAGEPVDVGYIFEELGLRDLDARSPPPPDIDAAIAEILQLQTPIAEPENLSSFIRKNGGIRDDGGDMAAIIGRSGAGDTAGRYRLINPRGITADEMAARAWEAGYFPERGGVETGDRPTPRELLDALDEELEGRVRYRLGDDDRVAAMEARDEALTYWAQRGVDLTADETTMRAQLARVLGREAEQAVGMEDGRAPDYIPHPPTPREIRDALDDAMEATLKEEGFAELSAEVRRLRALAEEVGEPLSADDLLFSRAPHPQTPRILEMAKTKTAPEIAEALGLPKATVYKILERNGVLADSGRVGRPEHPMKDEIVALAASRTVSEIAAETGISENTIRPILQRSGVEAVKASAARNGKRDARIRELVRQLQPVRNKSQGAGRTLENSYAEIARKLRAEGFSDATTSVVSGVMFRSKGKSAPAETLGEKSLRLGIPEARLRQITAQRDMLASIRLPDFRDLKALADARRLSRENPKALTEQQKAVLENAERTGQTNDNYGNWEKWFEDYSEGRPVPDAELNAANIESLQAQGAVGAREPSAASPPRVIDGGGETTPRRPPPELQVVSAPDVQPYANVAMTEATGTPAQRLLYIRALVEDFGGGPAGEAKAVEYLRSLMNFRQPGEPFMFINRADIEAVQSGAYKGAPSIETVQTNPAADAIAALDTALSRSFGGDYAKLKKSAKVEIVATPDDVPGLRKVLDETGAIGAPGAVHVRSKGKTYLIASGVTPDRAARVLLHEVGVHHGMAKMLGAKGFERLTKEVAGLVEAEHPVAVEASQLAETFALNKADTAEETLAYLVENAPELPVVKRLIADIRQWLWKTFGADFGMKLTVDDIRAMAVASLRRVAREAVRKDLGVEIMDASPVPDAQVMASAKSNGFSGSDIGEAREWVEAVRKGLDMSLEARMARAREMGFREDTAYRGIVRPYDAAKAGRFQWFTSSAEDAGEYAGDGAFDGGNILAARIRSGRELKITGNGRNFTSIDTGQLPAEVRARLHPSIGDVARSDDIADAAQKAGYDSVRIENVFDNRSGEIPRRPAQSLPKGDDELFAELEAAGFDMTPAERAPKAAPEIARNYDPVTVTAVFDPPNIRSIHAAFDPDRAGEGNILASMRSTGRREPPAELPSPKARADWVRDNVLEEQVPGEAVSARQYGFGISTGDAVVMSVVPDSTGAATVEWTFADVLESGGGPYQPSGKKVGVLAEILPRVIAILEADVAKYDRDAYVFTPALDGLNRVYAAALRRFGSGKYAMVEVDGDFYLIHEEADLAEDNTVLPRPGRKSEAPEIDDGADGEARQTAFFQTLSRFVRDEQGRTGRGIERSGRPDGSGERPAGPRAAQDEAARQEALRAYQELPPVDQALADEPDMEIDGYPAIDALEQADAEEQSARDMSKGYDAAINCAIRHGGSAS